MKIILSKYCDFCNGVKRSIKISEEILDKIDCVYSVGEVIHNSQVVNKLKTKGLEIVNDVDSISEGSWMLIRSHGISADSLNKAKKRKINLVDAACPFVKHIQKICKKLKKEGYFIVITGDKNHPEVEALQNIAGNANIIVSNPEEKILIPKDIKKIAVISQSTYTAEGFYNIIKKVLSFNLNEIRIYNTVCSDSLKRREEIKNLAGKVKVMLVIGGKNSANTKRLFEISKKINSLSFHLNKISEVKGILDLVKSDDVIGIIGGASTPRWLVKDFIAEIKKHKPAFKG